MSKGEIIPFRGDGEAQGFMREPTSPPSRRPAAGSGEDAGVSSASASSFVHVSEPVLAVVLRLQGRFPKIRVRGADREEANPRPSSHQCAEGERGD